MSRLVVEPLDPNSPKGREVAERLTTTLARIELSIAERKRREADDAERTTGTRSAA